MSKIDDGGPAFPFSFEDLDGHSQWKQSGGMTLRDYVAVKAFILFLAGGRRIHSATVDRGGIMTPLPVPTPEEYRRYPAHVLDRWMHVAARAGEHAEAEEIRKVISTPATEEAA